MALPQPPVELGDRSGDLAAAWIVDERPRIAVQLGVAAHEHDVACALSRAVTIEPVEDVDRELDVARVLQHPVDEHARIADRDEPAGAALTGDDDGAVLETEHDLSAFDL